MKCERQPHVFKTLVAKMEAIKLIELGAKPIQVHDLTGVTKSTVKHLYRKIQGRTPSGGQLPFTDTWYMQSNKRLLHANIAWRFGNALNSSKCDPAEFLIDLYEAYLLSVQKPLLDISHVDFISHLLRADIWQIHSCKYCGEEYVSPGADTSGACPACRAQHVYRCVHCGEQLRPKHFGRPLEHCPACGGSVRDPPIVTYQ